MNRITKTIASGFLALSLTGVVVAGPLALTGCALFGVPVAQNFDERVVAGYASVAAAADMTGVLMDAGQLTPADARNVHTQLINLKEGVDVAVAIKQSGDLSNAETRLTATIAALNILKGYLNSRRGN